MAKSKLISTELKEDIAKRLGVYDTVKTHGWGAVSSKDCGNIVKEALQIANKTTR